MTSSEPTAVGVHIYGGGFTLGVQRNMRVLGQLEEFGDDFGALTFERNFPHIYHPTDKSDWDLSRFGRPTLVYANPPCAPWSPVGARKGSADSRLEYTRTAVEVAKALQPEFFILESVCPAWTKGREIYSAIAKEFTDVGYDVTILLTNAILHGAPQSRERFHLIAHQYRLKLREPSLALEDAPLVGPLLKDLQPTARWIDETPVIPNHVVARPTPEMLNVMAKLPQGMSWNRVAGRMQEEEGYTKRSAPKMRLLAGRLHGQSTCRTVVDVNMLIHPYENRQVTLREGARLCGYPDNFVVAPVEHYATYKARDADLTQAVLPDMGDYLSRMCLISREEPMADGTFDVVDWRSLGRTFTPRRYLKARGIKYAK